MLASCSRSASMMARSAAWSAAVAKFARPCLRVTMSTLPSAIPSPTSTAMRRASAASAA